jgi:hypothetical protein
MNRLFPVLVVAQMTMLAEQCVKCFRPESAVVLRVTRFVWLIAAGALVYIVATSDHQWMVWRAELAARANATVIRLAGRDVSLIEFVNSVWSTVFVGVAIASAAGFLKAVVSRFRGTPMTAHA